MLIFSELIFQSRHRRGIHGLGMETDIHLCEKKYLKKYISLKSLLCITQQNNSKKIRYLVKMFR